MTIFSIEQRIDLTPTITPQTVKISHIAAIIHYLRTVVDVEPSEYHIVDIPTQQYIRTTPISIIVLIWAAFGDTMLYLVNGIGGALESAINRANGIIDAASSWLVNMVAMLIPLSVHSIYYVA